MINNKNMLISYFKFLSKKLVKRDFKWILFEIISRVSLNKLELRMDKVVEKKRITLSNKVSKIFNNTVQEGPFKGMKFLREPTEGCNAAKLLGTYEQPLHTYLDKIISNNYNLIINVGSAEGYYSVGLAMRCKLAKILSFDTNDDAKKACKDLAIKNNVESSIQIL